MQKHALFLLVIIVCTISNSGAQDMKMKITIGNKEFTATLNDNEAVTELLKLLPMEVTMNEHNGNEKYYNLPYNLPGKATNPGSVEAGDLMIWSANTLVLFYAGSRTSYSYIRIGKIGNPEGLREAVGRRSVKVAFELKRTEENETENNKE